MTRILLDGRDAFSTHHELAPKKWLLVGNSLPFDVYTSANTQVAEHRGYMTHGHGVPLHRGDVHTALSPLEAGARVRSRCAAALLV